MCRPTKQAFLAGTPESDPPNQGRWRKEKRGVNRLCGDCQPLFSVRTDGLMCLSAFYSILVGTELFARLGATSTTMGSREGVTGPCLQCDLAALTIVK
jgi:hypothetical protein